MRKILRKIVRILDGTAAEYGRRESGQSLVELALFMPILILMLTGLAEMGWYTNNYLILLEVSRVAARFGTVLTGNNDPISWEQGSVTFEGDDGSGNLVTFRIDTLGNTMPPANYYSAPGPVRDCANNEGFYEAVVCLALDSMFPLALNPDDDPANLDDIVVSVFSTNAIPDPSNPELTSDEVDNINDIGNNRPFKDPGQDADFLNSAPIDASDNPNPDATQIMVTGRYPAMANECANDHRDPFDLNGSGDLEPFELDSVREQIREADPDDDGTPDNPLMDASDDEGRRGFALTGRWTTNNPAVAGCSGSEWNIRRMESLINLRGIGLTDEEMLQVPDEQAFALVEIMWNHQLLLAVPGFSPFFDILGGENGSYIYVWAAFPIPSAEFNLNLDQ